MSGVFSRNAFELFRQQLERRDKKRLDLGKSFSERRVKMERRDGDLGDLIFSVRNVGWKKSEVRRMEEEEEEEEQGLVRVFMYQPASFVYARFVWIAEVQYMLFTSIILIIIITIVSLDLI